MGVHILDRTLVRCHTLHSWREKLVSGATPVLLLGYEVYKQFEIENA